MTPPVGRPARALTPAQERRLERVQERADRAAAAYRAEVLAVLGEGASYAQLSASTGLSTNTIQRWKRESEEAGRE